MKFKNKENAEYVVLANLSEKESDKYNLPSLIEIEDTGMARTVTPGSYFVKLDNLGVDIIVDLSEADGFFTAEGKIGAAPYKIIKDRPIRKYDLYRHFIINYKEIKQLAEVN